MRRFDNTGITRENDGAFDDVLQFAHVAGPVMARRARRRRFVRKPLRGAAVFAGGPEQEMLGQEWDVFPAVAQGRHLDGDDVEAKEEVFAELLPFDALFEMAVGGGDDAHVHLDGAVAADAFQFALLEHAQQFGLDGGGNLADFVQQDGSAVGQFEPAFAFVESAGKRALFVAEELALDEVSGNGGAVDLDERGAGAAGFPCAGRGRPVPCRCRFRPGSERWPACARPGGSTGASCSMAGLWPSNS